MSTVIMDRPTLTEMRIVRNAVNAAQESVDILILRIPTGPAREAVTEANMLIMLAESKLAEAQKLIMKVA